MLRPLLLAIVLTLGACASSMPLVQARAPGPLAPATFQVSAAPDEAAGTSGVERSVAAALQARGLSQAGGVAEAVYLVEVALSARPRGVAAAVPRAEGTKIVLPAADRTWRRPLVKGAETLTIRIVERVSGRELYAASATAASRGPVPTESLVRSALQPLAVTR